MEAQGEADAPYAAFDMAADRLSTRLRRHKRRLRDHHKMADSVQSGIEAQSYILAADAEADRGEGSEGQDATSTPVGDPNGDPVIIAEMTTEIPSMHQEGKSVEDKTRLRRDRCIRRTGNGGKREDGDK